MDKRDDAPGDAWGFGEGDAITDDLTVIKLLGGGTSYEAYLAFDDVTYAPTVVKVVRPHRVTDESSLRGLARVHAAVMDRVLERVVLLLHGRRDLVEARVRLLESPHRSVLRASAASRPSARRRYPESQRADSALEPARCVADRGSGP